MVPFIILLALLAIIFIALAIKYRRLAKHIEYIVEEERCRRKDLEREFMRMQEDFMQHLFTYH